MAKACIKRLHALEDDSLVSAIAITADGCGKTDLFVCIDEAEPTGLGIYADRHWREVQIKGHVFW